jgi:hypothetical protein
MIIATDVFDMDKVIALRDDYEGLCNYIWTLVPDRYRHIDVIYHNTRYYINMCVLKNALIPLDKKLQVSKYLTKQIRVVGYTDTYITCSELEKRINMSKVDKYHEGDKR